VRVIDPAQWKYWLATIYPSQRSRHCRAEEVAELDGENAELKARIADLEDPANELVFVSEENKELLNQIGKLSDETQALNREIELLLEEAIAQKKRIAELEEGDAVEDPASNVVKMKP
jgi:cell division protein FtsB